MTREHRVGDSMLRMALASGCGASRHATASIRQARGKVVGRAVASSSLCGHSRSLLSFSLLRIFCVWPARCARFLFPFSFFSLLFSSTSTTKNRENCKTIKATRQTVTNGAELVASFPAPLSAFELTAGVSRILAVIVPTQVSLPSFGRAFVRIRRYISIWYPARVLHLSRIARALNFGHKQIEHVPPCLNDATLQFLFDCSHGHSSQEST